jgi:hypothetical protein
MDFLALKFIIEDEIVDVAKIKLVVIVQNLIVLE